MTEEEKKQKRNERRKELRVEKKEYELRKECTDRFFEALESIGYHAVDINRSSGYFIFYFGGDSIINFNIKELPGWRFGLWWVINKNGSNNYIESQFFTQFEIDIDKFKPSRSLYVENYHLNLDKTGFKLFDYSKFHEGYNVFKSEIIPDVKDMLDFIKTHPYRAWARSYSWEGQKYYLPWSNFRCWYEYRKNIRYHRRQERIQKKYDMILINWIINHMSKYFTDMHLRKLDFISPCYEFYAPLSKNKDIFSDRGIYGMFYTDEECEEILNNPDSSPIELELAKNNKSLRDKYHKLEKKLDDRATSKGLWYYPEVNDDILILKDKDYSKIRESEYNTNI